METLQEFIRKEISDYTYGTMSLEISPSSYDDRLDEATLLKTYNDFCENCGNSDFYEKFSDYLENIMYEKIVFESDWDYEIIAPLLQQIEHNLESKDESLKNAYEKLKEDHSDFEILEESGFKGFDLDYTGFLDKDYKFNLMLATPEESDSDMGSIPCLWGGEMDYSSLESGNVDNALTYLIHQQEHTLAEVLHGEKNKFIESVASELDEYQCYSMGGLTACVAMSGQEMLDVLDAIAKKEGNIELSKNTTIGIFEPWNGAGSLLEIELEKPVIVPASMIVDLQLENAGRENNGYTVDATYGLVGSCWTNGSIKTTNEQPVLRDESFEDIKKAFVEKFEQQQKNKI